MSSVNSLEKALMRKGDFHLRRDDRQLFGNYVLLSVGGGTPGPLSNARRSAAFVETPVYEAPKLWRVEVLFSTPQSTPAVPLSPFLPGGSNDMRIKIRHALDRDKYVAQDEFTITSAAIPGPGLNMLPVQYIQAQQLGVAVEALGPSLTIVGTQVSVVEVTARDEGEGFGAEAVTTAFVQSAGSQVFLAPNARRRQFFITNTGSDVLYVGFHLNTAPPPAPTFTFALPNFGDVYESPRDGWLGAVSGVWASGAGGPDDFALVTELR